MIPWITPFQSKNQITFTAILFYLRPFGVTMKLEFLLQILVVRYQRFNLMKKLFSGIKVTHYRQTTNFMQLKENHIADSYPQLKSYSGPYFSMN